MKEKYKFRKNVIKGVIGLSEDIDDSLTEYKRATMVLLIKFFICLFALTLVIIVGFRKQWFQLILFLILFLSSLLSYLGEIRKFRLIKSLAEIKSLREVK
jgi:hypothetical protein